MRGAGLMSGPGSGAGFQDLHSFVMDSCGLRRKLVRIRADLGQLHRYEADALCSTMRHQQLAMTKSPHCLCHTVRTVHHCPAAMEIWHVEEWGRRLLLKAKAG